MRTPEEIFKLLRSQTECGLYEPGTQCQQCDDEAKRMLDIALDIQAEAYNDAIDDLINRGGDGYVSAMHGEKLIFLKSLEKLKK